MKKISLLAVILLSVLVARSQTFNPVATTGYSLDAVAENTTAMVTTGGAIDGSNYVLYSAAYGALYSVTSGLPNSGLIASGTRTYQLEPYTQNNLLYITAGLSGTLTLTTPAPYAGLSLLAFSTEGDGSLTATIVFTDNSTQVFTGQSLPDWFNSGNTVISGFDRVSRSIGTPANLSGNPKMYYIDLPILCANRSKLVSDIVIQNTSSNARTCVMAVAGTGAPTFSASSQPVTCQGGTNGSASITATGGLPPVTFTWNTIPAQNVANAINLPVGTYSYSAQDNGGCIFTSTVAVTQSLVPEPALSVSSNVYTICSGGTFTMGASGANTFSWTNGPNTAIYSPGPLTAQTPTNYVYNVSGHTSSNCLRTGSISILVNPLPAVSFTGALQDMCVNQPPLQLSPLVQQPGGSFSGPGIIVSVFTPSMAGTGTFTILYTRTDANNCTNSATTSIQVFSLAVPQITQPAALCANHAAITLTGNPAGGTFAGNGVSNGQFNPAVSGAGVFPVGYTITSGPCVSNSAINITVNGIPSASITGKTFFCVTHAPYIFNGSPSGGVYSGPGLTGGTFDPKKAVVGNSNILVYTYTNISGCTDTASMRVTVSACVGLNELNGNNTRVEVYPNPSTGEFNVKANEQTELVIINSLGQVIREITLVETGQYETRVRGLTPGVYFIRFNDHGNFQSRKLVIKE